MAGQKFLQHNGAGGVAEVIATQVGGGGAANLIPSLDAAGKLDVTMMPTGTAADTGVITASENLAAGDFVNIWNSTGAKARKADATVAGKEAMGFVLSAVLSGASATVYFEGSNTGVTGQTPGPVYLSTTAGIATTTPPSAAGNVVQPIGFAISTTVVNFQSGQSITKA
jgi:hypothetical protein